MLYRDTAEEIRVFADLMKQIPEGDPNFVLKQLGKDKNNKNHDSEEEKSIVTFLSLENAELDYMKQFNLRKI